MADHQHDARHKAPKPPKKANTVEKASSRASITNETLRLQALIGNQAVQRLLAQGHTMLPSGTMVQAKLTVTSADNAYESEADSVAEQVVSQMASGGQEVQRAGEEDELQMKRATDVMQRAGEEDELQMKRFPDVVQRAGEEDELQMKRFPDVVQRAGEEDELQMKRFPDVVQRAGEEDELQMKRDSDVVQRAGEEDELQMKRGQTSLADSFDVDSQVEQQIKAEQGRGQAMPADIQRSMEGAFGADFSNVRVHTDGVSNELNAQVGARAFTTGADVFFREGEFKPDTADGKKLLAHELTHTIQQDAVRRKKQGDE